MALVEQPRTIILNEVSFSEEEIKELKKHYSELDMAIFDKAKVRAEAILQKGLTSGAIVCMKPEVGDQVTLHLSQDGRKLLNKV